MNKYLSCSNKHFGKISLVGSMLLHFSIVVFSNSLGGQSPIPPPQELLNIELANNLIVPEQAACCPKEACVCPKDKSDKPIHKNKPLAALQPAQSIAPALGKIQRTSSKDIPLEKTGSDDVNPAALLAPNAPLGMGGEKMADSNSEMLDYQSAPPIQIAFSVPASKETSGPGFEVAQSSLGTNLSAKHSQVAFGRGGKSSFGKIPCGNNSGNGLTGNANGETALGDNSTSNDELSNYKNAIRELIDTQKIYPALARKNGIEGKVSVSFLIAKNGELKDVKLVGSSSHQILDQAAIQTINNANPFRPLPKSITKEELWLKLAISFKLDN